MSMLSSINFTGLTKNLSRQPYDKLPAMQKVVDSSGSSIAGKLPRDITKEIIKNHPNPKLAIKELYSDFANCANILQGIFLATAESVDDFEVFPVWREIYDLRYLGNLWETRKFVEKTFVDNEKVVAKEEKIINKAQEMLTHACKKANIIPPNGVVEIYSLGQGSFGAAYQMLFLDEDKKEIFHSKVMKVFPLRKEEKEAVT